MYKQKILILRYNKDVLCVIEQDSYPKCKTISTPSRRSNRHTNNLSHDPYLPNARDSIFYNCSTLECNLVKVHSLTQLATPLPTMKYCYLLSAGEYKCETLKYYHFKNIDKLLFLKNNIKYTLFYLIDCLAYADGGRVCHKKDDIHTHTDLVDIGNITRPKEANILSQEEFLCEENENKKINCDHDRYVPYPDGLKEKDFVKIDSKILLKLNDMVVNLNYNCIEAWCGYSGEITPTRRFEHYEPPGGKVYRCFYANRQQVCKEIYGKLSSFYNERAWGNI